MDDNEYPPIFEESDILGWELSDLNNFIGEVDISIGNLESQRALKMSDLENI